MNTLPGTKIKQARKAQARANRRNERFGGTKPAMRATRENIAKFAPDQKLRSSRPLSVRKTALILSGVAKTRTMTPRAIRKARSEALKGAGVIPALQAVRDAVASAIKPAVSERRRERNLKRAHGLRFHRDLEPGININAPGKWIDATGRYGVPLIGTARVRIRRMISKLYQAELVAAREMISVGHVDGMTTSAGE